MEAMSTLGWEGWFSIGVVVFCFGMFAHGRVAPDLVTSAGLTLLLVFGIITPTEALAGFSNQGMLTVAVLYVVVTGLTETGAVGWIGQALLGTPRAPAGARALRLMAPVAAFSAFLNNTPVVAIFIPAVQDWAKRHRLELSRLMIPLSYASIAGGTCTLIGTSTNLVVDGLYAAETGTAGFALFELAWIGLPVVAVVMHLSTSRPDTGCCRAGRRPRQLQRCPPIHRRDADRAGRQPAAGKSVEAAGLRQLPGLFLMEIDRDGQIIPGGLVLRDAAGRRSTGVRRHPGLGDGPAAHARPAAGHESGVQARRPTPGPLLRRGGAVGQVPAGRQERARGPLPHPLQRGHRRARPQRRAGQAQDR